MRAVLDTSVLVSSFLFGGISAQLLARADDAFELLLSPSLLEELARTLRKPKFARRGLTESDIIAFSTRLRLLGDVVSGLVVIPTFVPDPDDTHVLACAVEGRADYLVTGDKELLQLVSYQDTKIVSPREFLRLLDEEVAFPPAA